MHRAHASAGATIFLIVCSASVLAQPAADRETRWREDLKSFASTLASQQKDFAKLYPNPAFNAEIAAIEGDIARLSDADIKLRLIRLVASAKVGHNKVIQARFERLPMTLHWYADGLAVIGAASAYSAALGTRVVRIGTMTPEQLLTAVAPYVSYENDAWLKEESTG